MVAASSLQLSNRLGINKNSVNAVQPKCKTRNGQLHFFSSNDLMKDAWSLYVLSELREPRMPVSSKCKGFLCHAILFPNGGDNTSAVQNTAYILKRAFNCGSESSAALKLAPAICIFAFAVWGLQPLIRMARNAFLQRSDSTWKKSSSYHITTSYVQPLLLWTGTMLICRELEPMNFPVEASHSIKERLLHFIRSLSTVMTFAYCLSSLIQQIQKILTDTSDSNDARNMGFQFAGKAVYTAVWVAAVSLFMELLGFSTKKWVTAGGLGTVLLTLAGREILTNFLSSVMIHTTRPFVLNEWIQTKIEGYEVSGTVEHVGWWSPTIIRGDDREAVHIPNHKFTVNIVRNLTQKSHWRIKTHFAISHLDVNKINNIVADMRKVLAKNPQVEQQKLHRRVFLDYVDPENQALLILVSCFVKTSHFEEYLCVKEAVLLDLMRVISHHGARLATPIRTFQRLYTGGNAEEITVSGAQELDRPFLLTDSSYKTSTLNKAKILSRPEHGAEEKDSEPAEHLTSDMDIASKTEDDKATSSPASPSSPKQPTTIQEMRGNHASKKPEDDKSSDSPSPASKPMKPALEDNIVLGVALEGAKRTLPIDGTSPQETDVESKELTACPSGSPTPSVQEKKAAEQTSSPASGMNPGNQRDKSS